jgi:hypothetical protein
MMAGIMDRGGTEMHPQIFRNGATTHTATRFHQGHFSQALVKIWQNAEGRVLAES